jgi:hypothetical protein
VFRIAIANDFLAPRNGYEGTVLMSRIAIFSLLSRRVGSVAQEFAPGNDGGRTAEWVFPASPFIS